MMGDKRELSGRLYPPKTETDGKSPTQELAEVSLGPSSSIVTVLSD